MSEKKTMSVGELSGELVRKNLASIDLSCVEDDKAMSETERRAYASAVHAVFPRLEKDVKRFMYQQLLFNSKESETWEQVLFGRGSLDGMAQLLGYWNGVSQEHADNSNKDPKFDKHSPVGEM